MDSLRRSYANLKRNAAAGVEGVTWHAYGDNLEDNLVDLLDRVHRGAYRARPSRRVYIAKADGRQRPLGIASLEDKLPQRAVVEVMNAVYEADFLGFTHICSVTRSGKFQVKRRTSRKTMTAKLKDIRRVLTRRRHAPSHRKAGG